MNSILITRKRRRIIRFVLHKSIETCIGGIIVDRCGLQFSDASVLEHRRSNVLHLPHNSNKNTVEQLCQLFRLGREEDTKPLEQINHNPNRTREDVERDGRISEKEAVLPKHRTKVSKIELGAIALA